MENRYRVLGQVLKKVRVAVGDDFPVLIKLNSQDFLEGGLRLEDSVIIGGWLQEYGIDAIELSGGTDHRTGDRGLYLDEPAVHPRPRLPNKDLLNADLLTFLK